MQINASKSKGILDLLAKKLGSRVENGKLTIPKKYGSGYLHGFFFGEHMRMMIRNYVLNQDLSIIRSSQNHPDNMILFQFQNIISNPGVAEGVSTSPELPSVQVTTLGMSSDILVSRNTSHRSILIIMDAAYLAGLIDSDIESPVLSSILKNKQPLIFEQMVFPSLQQVADNMTGSNVPVGFQHFFYRLKAEELICTLLMELVKREDAHMYALNVADIQMLYRIKDLLLKDLDDAPSIEVLAKTAGMSEAKLKRLFKQVFGKSIFNYYQSFRMKEAARLLREEKLSVSQVGYQLGFSNLSHFTRVFEEHVGSKPKKYSMS